MRARTGLDQSSELPQKLFESPLPLPPSLPPLPVPRKGILKAAKTCSQAEQLAVAQLHARISVLERSILSERRVVADLFRRLAYYRPEKWADAAARAAAKLAPHHRWPHGRTEVAGIPLSTA